MEVKNMSGRISSTNEKEEYGDVPLPGFRFHPTDEELVGFYLRRKVEKRPAAIELIKQADIYKYDPWDLPKSNNAEDQKEWYFFCRRGRKYKNSIRPNRVTGSGFWKATGIDRPIYKGRECIGLKKSLVYYRGSAGKGTKTEWMMHEFRLPPTGSSNTKTTNIHMDAATIAQEAEVWTLCRILKRNVPYRKSEYNFRNNINEVDAKRSKNIMNSSSSVTCSVEFSCDQNNKNIAESKCISFQQIEKKPFFRHLHDQNINTTANDQQSKDYCFRPSSVLSNYPPSISDDASLLLSDNPTTDQFNELLMHVEWEDLQSILDCTACF